MKDLPERQTQQKQCKRCYEQAYTSKNNNAENNVRSIAAKTNTVQRSLPSNNMPIINRTATSIPAIASRISTGTSYIGSPALINISTRPAIKAKQANAKIAAAVRTFIFKPPLFLYGSRLISCESGLELQLIQGKLPP
jgi:hypothetical protein